MKVLTHAKRIVIKTGSALIADHGAPRTEWMSTLAADVGALREAGQQVVLVTSGAIALGKSMLGKTAPIKLEQKQAAAAFGQPKLISTISSVFAEQNIPVAQALLTLSDTENRRRWLNARATINTILDAGGLPVINENDTVGTEEIRYGDNDRLASRVAQMISADVLILLSDIDGLYTADPRNDPSAQHIPHLKALTDEHEAMAGGVNASAGVGSGGMVTKIAAAKIALSAGCATIITLGDRPQPLSAIINGAKSTLIEPSLTPAKAREIWLEGHLTPDGKIFVDNGAANALNSGASLLPVGVTGVEGQFDRGDAVAIVSPEGRTIAKGLSAYSAYDLIKIAGLQSEDVAERLGYKGRPAIVHRDDMVLMNP